MAAGSTISFSAIESSCRSPTPLWLNRCRHVHSWPPLQIYLCITIILSLIGWTSLARVVPAASGRSDRGFRDRRPPRRRPRSRIIFPPYGALLHQLPIAEVSLAIPGMILAETALSFLGLGLQPPMVSWGVLLQEAQNIRAIATAPWLFAPGIAVVIAVLALSFVGDGLRDAPIPIANKLGFVMTDTQADIVLG